MNKKIKFSADSIFGTTVILFVICALVTLALAVTNHITKGKISEFEEKNKKNSMAEVLAADIYSENSVEFTDENGTESAESYYIAVSGDKTVGFIFVTSQKGYGGDISVMTGIDTDGKITAVKILSADDETPGLGANVTKNSFYGQFEGKESNFELVKNSASENNQVVAVAGATISSTAVKNAVKKAFDLYELVNTEDYPSDVISTPSSEEENNSDEEENSEDENPESLQQESEESEEAAE